MKKSSNGLRTFLIIAAIIAGLCGLDYLIAFHTGSKNLAEGYSGSSAASGVIDENGIFDEDPAALRELDQLVKDTADELDMNILIYLPDESKRYYSDDAVRDFTANEYNRNFGEFTDGLLYYIDISGKSPACDDIAKSGKASLIYTDSVCQSIFYSLDEYLPPSSGPVYPDQISNAITHFCPFLVSYYDEPDRSEQFHDDTANVPTYTYTKNGKLYITKSKPPMKKLFICIFAELTGGLVALIIYLASRSRYKFKSKTNPGIYLANSDVRFTENSDVLIRSYITKHRIQSSSGGGGYRGGGGGGGHSHGGSISHSSHHR